MLAMVPRQVGPSNEAFASNPDYASSDADAMCSDLAVGLTVGVPKAESRYAVLAPRLGEPDSLTTRSAPVHTPASL
jgi:hypothetical protein